MIITFPLFSGYPIMCLTLFAYQTVPGYPLILLSNRDEFQSRPTHVASFWDHAPHLMAGRDAIQGGTWLGLTKDGRIANVTNHRNFRIPAVDVGPSRGALTADFLLPEIQNEGLEAQAYLERIHGEAKQYNGFSLLLGTLDALWYYSNREGKIRNVEPGFHGVSNDLLNTPWPKLEDGRATFRAVVEQDPQAVEELLQVMRKAEVYPDADLPDTGRDLDFERLVSPIFIENPIYGTRMTTLIRIREDGHTEYIERTYNSNAQLEIQAKFEFQVT